MAVDTRELAVIGKGRPLNMERCGLKSGAVFMRFNDPGQKLLKAIRGEQKKGHSTAVILMRESLRKKE